MPYWSSSVLTSLLAPCLVRLNTNTWCQWLSFMRCSSSLALRPLSTGWIRWRTVSTVVLRGATSTSPGWCSMVFASWRISSEKVALNSSDCFFFGSSFWIRRMSWMKPMSRMRSASSSTSTSTPSSCTASWPCRSSSRPGVATRMSTPRCSWRICGLMFTPPNTTRLDRRRLALYSTMFDWIWAASSRVGVTISARTRFGAGRGPSWPPG